MNMPYVLAHSMQNTEQELYSQSYTYTHGFDKIQQRISAIFM